MYIFFTVYLKSEETGGLMCFGGLYFRSDLKSTNLLLLRSPLQSYTKYENTTQIH